MHSHQTNRHQSWSSLPNTNVQASCMNRHGVITDVAQGLWLYILPAFSFSVVEILRLLNAAKFCIFKNIVLFVIELGRELCFLFFHFFIFYANIEFQPPPCQLTKMKFSEICSNFPLSILAISS